MKPIAALTLFLACLPALAAEPAAPPAAEPFEAITQKQIDAITYDDAAVDQGFVTPLAKDLSHLDDERKQRLDAFEDKLDQWKPGQEKAVGQRVRNWMAACTYADMGRGEFEAEVPFVIFERLRKEVPKDQLIKALAWVILEPKAGTTVTKAPELGVDEDLDEDQVRARSAIYAKKLLGRLLGKLPPKE